MFSITVDCSSLIPNTTGELSPRSAAGKLTQFGNRFMRQVAEFHTFFNQSYKRTALLTSVGSAKRDLVPDVTEEVGESCHS